MVLAEILLLIFWSFQIILDTPDRYIVTFKMQSIFTGTLNEVLFFKSLPHATNKKFHARETQQAP